MSLGSDRNVKVVCESNVVLSWRVGIAYLIFRCWKGTSWPSAPLFKNSWWWLSRKAHLAHFIDIANRFKSSTFSRESYVPCGYRRSSSRAFQEFFKRFSSVLSCDAKWHVRSWRWQVLVVGGCLGFLHHSLTDWTRTSRPCQIWLA